MTLRNQHVKLEDLSFFRRTPNFDRKNRLNFGKNLFCFFWRSHHFSDQTDRKSIIFELGPGPLLVSGGTVATKQKPNFSIINYSFNFYCSLKAKSNLEVSKIHKGSLAYYLALIVDIIEVFVLAKSSWQIVLVTKTRFQSQHYYLLKT